MLQLLPKNKEKMTCFKANLEMVITCIDLLKKDGFLGQIYLIQELAFIMIHATMNVRIVARRAGDITIRTVVKMETSSLTRKQK